MIFNHAPADYNSEAYQRRLLLRVQELLELRRMKKLRPERMFLTAKPRP